MHPLPVHTAAPTAATTVLSPLLAPARDAAFYSEAETLISHPEFRIHIKEEAIRNSLYVTKLKRMRPTFRKCVLDIYNSSRF